MIAFTTVNGEYGWLSNMSNHPIEYMEKVYPRAEHWFICSRFDFEPRIIEQICSDNNPITVKKLSKKILQEEFELLKVKMLSNEDVNNMRKLIRMKVEQYPWMKWHLMCTGTQRIYEDVTKRVNINDSSLFWGAAHCANFAHIESFWAGENMLGELWMKLRDELTDNFYYNECSKSSENGMTQFLKHKETGEIVQRNELNSDEDLMSSLINKITEKYFKNKQ